MRRLRGLMKAKRRISERSSESEASEENGVQQQRNNNRTTSSSSSLDCNVKETDDSMGSTKDSQDVESTSTPTRRSMKKRISRTKASAATPKYEEGDSETTASLKDDVEGRNNSDNFVNEQENGATTKSGSNKRRRRDDQKEKQKVSNSNRAENSDNEREYEVERIVGHRTIKGRRQFLIRWKGYGEDADTWEQEKDLKCHKLIEDYLDELANEEAVSEKPIKSQRIKTQKQEKEKDIKKLKHSTTKKKSYQDEGQKNNSDEDKNDTDNQKEFEVERIIEVRFKRNKTREFLIHWKGFSHADNTWEPEENLQNCHELITKFMQKVENARNLGVRELRSNRLRTKRYTLAMHKSERRLSRRNMDKERATYHEYDE